MQKLNQCMNRDEGLLLVGNRKNGGIGIIGYMRRSRG